MDPLPHLDLERMAHACDQFEAAWRRGDNPRIESFLEGLSEPAQLELAANLREIEAQLQRSGVGPAATPDAALTTDHGSSTEAAIPPESPSIPGFEIDRVLGRGGMGIVYRAWQLALERHVAIKIIAPSGSLARFRREALLIAQVHSPHVVAIHDLRTTANGTFVLVMEYIDGTDLGRLIRASEAPLGEPEVLPWMRQVAQGMQAAAERRIVHRDLKPSNILIDQARQARVADFGLGRGPSEAFEEHTQWGELLGTPLYMAPEQAEDPQGVDTRADIYSFGATFYHALTGHPPFDGATSFVILTRHKSQPVVAPQARNPVLSDHVSEILERCLAKNPADRFPSFAELLAQLDPRPAGSPSPWDMPDDPAWLRYLQSYRARRNVYLHGPDLGLCDVYEFPRNQRIRIVRGDLAEQQAEVLVSSETCSLRMEHGVSLALRRAAGDAVQADVQRFAPLRPGRVAVTTAGRLGARFLFHAVTMGPRGQDWISPTRDLISEILESCFYQAESLSIRSLALPLFGTGAGQLSREVCLDTLFRDLARRFLHRPTCVEEATVVVYPDETCEPWILGATLSP